MNGLLTIRIVHILSLVCSHGLFEGTGTDIRKRGYSTKRVLDRAAISTLLVSDFNATSGISPLVFMPIPTSCHVAHVYPLSLVLSYGCLVHYLQTAFARYAIVFVMLANAFSEPNVVVGNDIPSLIPVTAKWQSTKRCEFVGVSLVPIVSASVNL